LCQGCLFEADVRSAGAPFRLLARVDDMLFALLILSLDKNNLMLGSEKKKVRPQ